MKILITNAYSYKNKGDAGIILGMLKDLSGRKTFREAEFLISSADYPADSECYSCPVVPSFSSLKNTFSKNPYLQSLSFLVIIFPLSLIWAFFVRYLRIDLPVLKRIRQLLRSYRDADLIIAAGGGYIYTSSKLLGNLILLMTLYNFYFAILLGKPVYLYSQSIGPVAGKFQSWLIKRALRRVRLIEIREETSFNLVQSWHFQTPVYRTVDAAFLIPSEKSRVMNKIPTGQGIRIGITARKWFRKKEEQEQYERRVADCSNWLIDEMGAIIISVPQVTFEGGGDDDRTIARNIFTHIKSKNSMWLIEDELTPQQIKGVCGRMNLFVGTRMHSNIYALSMNVPTLAIAYQPKTMGIMKQLGLGKFVLPIENLSLPLFKEKFELLIKEQNEIRVHLQKKIPEICQRVDQNSRLIEDDYLTCRRKSIDGNRD
jgi:colanic acid/amylovoran biosynthesis protein WcaK/AmsJ